MRAPLTCRRVGGLSGGLKDCSVTYWRDDPGNHSGAATGNREEREMISAMSDMSIDDDSDGRPTKRAGKHCDACGEWLDSSDTHCPSCGSER